MQWVSQRWGIVSEWSWQWIRRLDAFEIPFCVLAFVVGAGLFFPKSGIRLIGGHDRDAAPGTPTPAYLYLAFRNTLLCLIALFGVYLVFEFQTLFRREFPEGFYYAGYAHEGAAWLTVALALATGTLSVIFHGATLSDPRIGRLKTLAGVWSATNLLLAVAVYNRLTIYVQFNGLTYLRIVGYFGITAVVVGFVLVIAKITLAKGFWWLMRAQMTALLLSLVTLSLFPADWVAHRYNVAAVTGGYLPPSVMIAVKDMDDSGYLTLLPLADCPDQTIREGVRAMLAEKQIEIEQRDASRAWHWTRYQAATDQLYSRLADQESKWHHYLRDSRRRNQAISAFEDYAMRWY